MMFNLPTLWEIKKSGGYTHGLDKDYGYMVSLSNYEYILQEIDATDERWLNYFCCIPAQVRSKPNHVGVWYNPDNKCFYFDVSRWVETLEEALKLGKFHCQLAVYDIANQTSINI